jgi:hypothetical protein
MNHLRGIYTIWYRDVLRFWHDKLRLMGSLTFPLLFLFIFGSGLKARMGVLGPGIDFTQFIFPGIIGMSVLMSSFMAGFSVVWDREFGFLKEVLVAPISRGSVALGKAMGSATIALIQGSLLLVCAPLIGVSLSLWTVLALLPLLFLLAASLGSLGILLATSDHHADADVSHGIPLRSFLSSGRSAFVDEFPGKNQSGHLWYCPDPPGDSGVRSHPFLQLQHLPLRAGADGLERGGYSGGIRGHHDIFGAIMILLAVWSFSHQSS